ncbi:ribose-phosphate pyrophosphokinase [Clydaea vesicula]|uniref:ribose-phosphate diphosphokinase n=1 Tax=Clydaea vesicula TaxID=447962 RepID=A0AAD5U2C2_9FUNG|nr:ribose-phosphate pyrophosphokinase [Clydaea vesicula]KAJ3388847.1 ribose-phosphate pyrophosphokinase [Lobulomyces angularis]
MRGITVFSGSSHPELSNAICERLGIPLGRCKLSKFSNRETNVEIKESIRDTDVYIIQSGCGHVNDNLMELLIMISACRTASAKKVTAVIPCFPYARQPESNKRGAALSSRIPLADVDKLSQLYDKKKHSTSSRAPSTDVLNKSDSTVPLNLQDSLSSSSVSLKNLKDVSTNSFTELERSSRRVSTISTSQSKIAITTLIPQPITEPELPSPVHSKSSNYKCWTARSGTLIADLLMTAGADHIITMDLHDPQFQGFFSIPVDNLFSQPLFIKYIKEKIPDFKKAVIVSPDAGGAKRATVIADKLNMDFALVHKERRHKTSAQDLQREQLTSPTSTITPETEMMLVGDVAGKSCIIVDDIADTFFTISFAAKLLRDSGATKIYALITHAIMSGDAMDRLRDSDIDEMIVSNSVPQASHIAKSKGLIKTFDVAPLFSEAIRRIHNGESVSFLFDVVDI